MRHYWTGNIIELELDSGVTKMLDQNSISNTINYFIYN